MIYKSIWEDTYYSLDASNSPFNYYITYSTTDEEVEIFRGRAYAKPGAQFIDININYICKNYLSNYLSDSFLKGSDERFDCYDAIKVFNLYNSDTQALVEQYTFLADYSYDFTFRGATNIGHSLSKPINGVYSANRYNNQYNTTIEMDSNGYYLKTVKRSNNYPNPCCGDVELVYLNRYGGWDKLVFGMKPQLSDTYTKYDIGVKYNNNTMEFGKKTYLNDIKRNYILTTDILTEKQSQNIAFNLFSSYKVYFMDYKHNIYKPCNITDTSINYQNFNTDDVIRYTVNIEIAQSQMNL